MRLFIIGSGIQALPLWSTRVRRLILLLMGVEAQKGATISEGVYIGSKKLRLGHRCFVNIRCYLDGNDWVTIGENVHLGPGVQVITANHRIGPPHIRASHVYTAPVTIEDGCWIGANAIIMPGVTVARGCIVGAGAVVTKDTQSNGVYVGMPARRTRDLSGGEPQKAEVLATCSDERKAA